MAEPAIEERVFAILTAEYHCDNELVDRLVAELDLEDRGEAITCLAALVRGFVIAIEINVGAPAGQGMPALIARCVAARDEPSGTDPSTG